MQTAWLVLLLAAQTAAAELEIRVIYDNTSARTDVREDWARAATWTKASPSWISQPKP